MRGVPLLSPRLPATHCLIVCTATTTHLLPLLLLLSMPAYCLLLPTAYCLFSAGPGSDQGRGAAGPHL